MTNDNWAACMAQAVSETVENLAFLEVTASPTALEADENTLRVEMLVHDPVQGEFRLTLPAQLLAQITETLYGQPAAAIPQATQIDLLAELLNTIAGRFLSELLPPETSFKLGLPTLAQGELKKPAAGTIAWHFQAAGMAFSLSASGESLLRLCRE